MFYDSVCLKGPHGLLTRILVSEYNDFEDLISWLWRHKHFPIGSPLDTSPKSLSVQDI